ncbi:MAG: hypothetical protein A3G35_07595 [candidate division NC10 bacterium RIFCSPLOWO2_12_FULL_66_18]|nr:MAG: hypothetical protein A3G35_07595 [candidate division NC10 bacterium RIFCSPLOWO2_12_FULL_66_18]
MRLFCHFTSPPKDKLVVEDMSRIRGEVSVQARPAVLEAIRTSRTLTREQKGQLLSSLEKTEQRDAERQN